MTFYLLLIVFSILMTIIAFGFIIGGLVKKKQVVWISSLVAFVFFSLLTVFSVVTYISESLDYMATDEFQEETKKMAENWGKGIGNTVSGAAEGLEAALDDDAIAELAEKSANIVGKGVESMAKGFDETLGTTTVFADQSIDDVEIKIGRAEEIYDSESEKYSFGLYLEFQKDFEGKLRLTAYDSEGSKMANSEIDINQIAGKEKIFIFQFDHFEPGLSGYCILTNETE